MATVVNALRLLNFFSQQQPEIGLTRFKELSGFDKGTAHRHLQALKSLGYLEQNSVTKAYRLGPTIMRLAAIRENTFPQAKIISMLVDELAAKSRELVHASLLTDEGMSPLYHRDGGITGTRVGFDASEILPLHATSSGMAMLAFGPVDLLGRIAETKLQKYTDETAIDLAEIKRLVSRTRDLGYSFMEQSYEAEVNSVAVPFFAGDGAIAGTLAIATPRSRMTRFDRVDLLNSVIETSRAISAGLGAQIPDHLSEKWKQIS